MKTVDSTALMIFIEPTPYLIDLIEIGFLNQQNKDKKIEVVFLSQNRSQAWNIAVQSNCKIVQSKKECFKLFVRIFLKRQYQLIHLAGWSGFFALITILFSRIFFIPVIVETDTAFNPMTAQWKQFIKKIFYPLLFKFPRFFLPAGKRQSAYLSRYRVPDNKMMQAQMTVHLQKIITVYEKIDKTQRDHFRQRYHASEKECVFLFVGRLLSWKGVDELLTAFEKLDDSARLWIVGEGERTSHVQKCAARDSRIQYFGRLSEHALWEVYCAADVFVIPSHAEPWGLVVNEAMCVGLPVIATRQVGCVDDLIISHHTGLIVKEKSVNELISAMQFMLNNQDERKKMGEQAQLHISPWTVENEAKNMIAAWKKCGWSENVYS